MSTMPGTRAPTPYKPTTTQLVRVTPHSPSSGSPTLTSNAGSVLPVDAPYDFVDGTRGPSLASKSYTCKDRGRGTD
ncbi:hypothetical protein AURDEDRAFT_171864 [Auricularia subglabra TFB-10046 SS5]|uniref:Uncharacterized protein n=1 Tax=Auricularia subglabra (strain TFB-10046 / SS5) TaxID=717982 RepID=J0LIL3_AURST|nr:hypothetical protein AURDEDRAFT_171864 [Auricularia subglabra TFB-10046 SS5]